jgi:DNA-binding response OmpR family regulator
MRRRDKTSFARSALLAEDAREVREFLTEILRRDGFEVISTGNGLTAWEEIKSRRFELIIIDMGLPGMDGIQILKKMKETGMATPVLAVSGVKIDKNAASGGYPNCTMIYKPFKLREIRGSISKLLNFECDFTKM